MVVTLSGTDKIRDWLKDSGLTYSQAGTDTTTPNIGDTALISPVTSTKKTLSVDDYGINPSSIQVSSTLSTGEGNGSALTEWSLLFSDDTMMSRAVSAAFDKTSSVALTRIFTIEIRAE